MPAAASQSRPAGHIHDGGAGDRFYIPASFRKGTAAAPRATTAAPPAPPPQQQQQRSYQPSVPNRTASTAPSSSSFTRSRPTYQDDGIRVGAGDGGQGGNRSAATTARPSSSSRRPYQHSTNQMADNDGIRVSTSSAPKKEAAAGGRGVCPAGGTGNGNGNDGIRVRPGGIIQSDSSRPRSRGAPPKQAPPPPSRRMTHPLRGSTGGSTGGDDGIRVRPGGLTQRGGTPKHSHPSYHHPPPHHHSGDDGIRVRAVY